MGVRCSKQRHKPRISKLQIPWLLRGAIRSNNMETLQYLFSYPNKVNPSMVIDGVCPLNLAVELGHVQMVKILIKAGADIHVADAPRYPLHQASIFGRGAVIELLIRSGASVSALTERRQSCLHLLCHQSAARFVEATHILMRHNANPNTLDDDGLAPLHRASVEMVHVLASYDVTDLNICSRDGDTPLLTAAKDRRESVLLALLLADQQYREQAELRLIESDKRKKAVCAIESRPNEEGLSNPGTCRPTTRTSSAKSTASTASRITLASASSAVFRVVGFQGRSVLRASSAASMNHHSVNTKVPQSLNGGSQKRRLIKNEVDSENNLTGIPRLRSCLLRISTKQSKVQSPEHVGLSSFHPVATSSCSGSSHLFRGLKKKESCKRCHSIGNPSDVTGWWPSSDRLQRLLGIPALSSGQQMHLPSSLSGPAKSPVRRAFVPTRPRLDLDKPDRIGMTPLMIAAEAGTTGLNMTIALVQAGSSVSVTDKTGMNALHHACYVGSLNVVRYLLERVQPISHQTINNGGSIGSTSKLVSSPSMSTGPSSTSQAASRMVIPELLNAQDKCGRTPIYLAACRGHTEVVNYLLSLSADFHVPNKENKSPLYISAYFGYLDITNALLRHGAEVDQRDSHRKTPLYVAVYHGRSDIVDLLLSAGANVNAADKNGKTPLYIAVLHGHLDLAKKLLNAGASVNRVDREGLGPLHMAVKFPKLDIPMVKLLLSYGCDPVNLASFTRWLLVHGIIPQEYIHGDDELARWLHWEECNVRSLKRLCRAVIQRALGNGDSMRFKLHRLPLPEHLLSYVSMKEL